MWIQSGSRGSRDAASPKAVDKLSKGLETAAKVRRHIVHCAGAPERAARPPSGDRATALVGLSPRESASAWIYIAGTVGMPLPTKIDV